MSGSNREKSSDFFSSSDGLHRDTHAAAAAAAGDEGFSVPIVTSNNNGSRKGDCGREGQREGKRKETASLHGILQRGLSRGTEDGDMSDWSRCLSSCQRMGKVLCSCAQAFSRKVYIDVARPWTKKFSDVGDRRGKGGDSGGMEEEGRGRVEEGRTKEERGLQRTISVEELRNQYVFGTLSSFVLEEELAEGGRELAREVKVIRKEDFLMKLAVALLSYGCPIPRIEHSMQGNKRKKEGRKGEGGKERKGGREEGDGFIEGKYLEVC